MKRIFSYPKEGRKEGPKRGFLYSVGRGGGLVFGFAGNVPAQQVLTLEDSNRGNLWKELSIPWRNNDMLNQDDPFMSRTIFIVRSFVNPLASRLVIRKFTKSRRLKVEPREQSVDV